MEYGWDCVIGYACMMYWNACIDLLYWIFEIGYWK
jgi:hypothetical protein